jgi:hypothetical protein
VTRPLTIWIDPSMSEGVEHAGNLSSWPLLLAEFFGVMPSANPIFFLPWLSSALLRAKVDSTTSSIGIGTLPTCSVRIHNQLLRRGSCWTRLRCLQTVLTRIEEITRRCLGRDKPPLRKQPSLVLRGGDSTRDNDVDAGVQNLAP